MSTLTIPGLLAVQAPVDPQRMPGLLTHDEVKEVVRSFGRGANEARLLSPEEIESDEDLKPQLLRIQDACQFKATIGQNPNRVGFEDFDIAIIDTDPDGDGRARGFADAGLAIAVRHRGTKRGGYFDLFYAFRKNHSGERWPHGAYATANSLVELAFRKRD